MKHHTSQHVSEWPMMGFHNITPARDFYTSIRGFEHVTDQPSSGAAPVILNFQGVFLHGVEGDPGPHYRASRYVRKPVMITPRRWRVGPVEFAWDMIEESPEFPETPPTLYIPVTGTFDVFDRMERHETIAFLEDMDYQAFRLRDGEGNPLQFFVDLHLLAEDRPQQSFWYWGWPSRFTVTPRSRQTWGRLMIGRHLSEIDETTYQKT